MDDEFTDDEFSDEELAMIALLRSLLAACPSPKAQAQGRRRLLAAAQHKRRWGVRECYLLVLGGTVKQSPR